MDLGTARGKVKVDADTKGLGKAEKDLGGFEKALKIVGAAAKAFETGLNKMERELGQASKDMREADRAAGGLDKSISDADRSTLIWTRDLRGLHERLKGVNQTAQDLGPSLLQVAKVGLEFRKTNGGIIGFSQAVTRAGAAATIISTLTSKFFGMGAAMAAAPAWSQSIIKFSNSFRLLTFGIGILTTMAAKTGLFTKAFEAIAIRSEAAGLALDAMGRKLSPVGVMLRKAAQWVGELNTQVDKIPKGAVQALVGFALMQNGLRGLAARFAFIARLSPKMMAIVGGAFAGLPAAIELGAVALRGFSNALALVLDAAKQLGGGLLAIPGGITMMVTAIGTLKVLLGSLKKAFEDVFKAKTPEEMAAAIDALPEHLKPLGKVLGEILPQWRAVVTDMQKTFVIGAETQLKALSDAILPAVRQGVLPLVNAFRQVKDEIVGFAAQGASISFIKQAFMDTTQTVLNLKDSIVPLLSGLRDVASVGMTFIRDMSSGAGDLATKFQEWAAANRENGNLMKWMKDAVQGVKDLWSGLKDAAKALWALLTLFQTDTGENALARFADMMERFNKAVQESKAGGLLKEIGDAVKQMGTEKIEQLWDVIRSLGDALKEVIPFVISVSKAFGEVFYPALKLTLEIIEQVTQFLNDIGAGGALGAVLGMVAAWKTLGIVLGPIRNVIQTVVGAFNLFKGAETLILGAAGTLEKFGPAGKKASDAILSIGDTIKGVFGGIGITAAIGLAFYEFYQEGAKQIDNMKAKVKELDDFTQGMGQDIASQIIDQGTLKNSADVFSNTIDEMKQKMQDAADAAPGMAAAFTDAMRATSEQPRIAGARFQAPGGPAHTAEFESGKKAAENAKLAKDAIDKLNLSSKELTQQIQGTDAGFDTFIAKLEASGEGGRAAAEDFRALRDDWLALQRAGEGGVQIAHGIDLIASSAGDASSKLEGLKTALEGAGLLKTTQLDAAFAYAESIREIGNAAKTSADQTQPFNDILDAQGHSYNVNSTNAANLHNDLSKLEGDYLRAVANGGDARAEWDKQGPALQNLADQYHLPIEKVKELAAAEGGLPTEISLLLSVEGGDEVKQDVVDAVLAARSAAKDQPVTIPIEGDPAQVKKAIESLLGPGSVIAQTDGTITISANVDKGALNNAIAVLTAAGIQVPGAPAPPSATIQVAPQVDRRGVKPAVTGPEAAVTEGVVVESGPAAKPPAVAVSPGDQATLDTAKTTIDDINKKVDDLNNKKIEIKADTHEIDEVSGKVGDLTKLLAGQEVKLKITVEGMEQFTSSMDQMKVQISTSLAQWNNYKIAVVQAFRDIVSAFGTAMTELATQIAQAGAQNQAAGAKFGNDFAQGIRDSIPAIAQAANDAAQAAADRMPHSPAKKGPLSGSGWSGYAGRAFATDFAEGIQSATSAAADASSGMAEAASKSMAGRDASFQTFMSGLIRILDIASTALGVVQSVFDHISEVYKISEDIRKGPEQPADAEHRGTGARPGPGGAARALPGAEGLRGVTDPSKEQIAAAIIGEAQKRGYGRDVAIGAIATGMLESGLNSVIENATGHKGIYQMDKAKPGRDSAVGQIGWFFDQLDALGAKSTKDPLNLIATQIEKGGYGGAAISQFTPEAASIYDRLIGSVNSNTASNAANTNATSSLRSDLTVTGRKGLKPAAENLLGVISAQFPGVKEIGGVRADKLPYHPEGRALDIMIGKNMQLGDQINAFLRDNSKELGIVSTIWRDTWRDMDGNISSVAGHMDHVHADIDASAKVFDNTLLTNRGLAISADGTVTMSDDSANNFADEVSSRDLSVYDGTNQQVNASYAKVDEAANNSIIKELRTNNSTLDESIKTGADPTKTDEEQMSALDTIQNEIQSLRGQNGDQNKEQVAALGEVGASITQAREERVQAAGAEQAAAATGDAFKSTMDIAGNVMGIAQDIIGLAKTAIETIGYVKASMDLLVRGVENTEQINIFIDTIQKFIELAAKVAQTVSDVAGMAKGMDFGASAIAGMISGILTTVNAVIDMAQEAWHIFGSYFGQFLGFLAGAGDQIEGDTRFLLDQNDKTLKAYGRNNPQDKAVHPYGQEVGGFLANDRSQQQPQIGSITVFGGPGQDPRETTRNMMFAVKTAAMGSTYAQ